MSRRCVGFGCNGRCAPGCGFFLRRLLTNSVVLFCPWLGGMLELSGVLGGRSSFARNPAISARRAAIASACRSIASACAKATPINSSRSSESNVVARIILTVNQRMIPESIPPTDIDERGEQLRQKKAPKLLKRLRRSQKCAAGARSASGLLQRSDHRLQRLLEAPYAGRILEHVGGRDGLARQRQRREGLGHKARSHGGEYLP